MATTIKPRMGKSGPTGAAGGYDSGVMPKATKRPMMGSRPTAAQRATHERVSGKASASLKRQAVQPPVPDMMKPGGISPAPKKREMSKAGARRDALKRMLK